MILHRKLERRIKASHIKFVSWILASIPIIYYFSIFFTNAVDAPHQDDYDTVLIYVNELIYKGSFFNKVWWSVRHMSNEHIVFLNHIVSWIQYKISGQINFIYLTFFGSAVVFLTWAYFLKVGMHLLHLDASKKSAELIKGLFLILSTLVIFNLSYYDSTFRATSLMQKIGVVLLAFSSFHLFIRGRVALSLLLAFSGILVNGNGLFIPIAILSVCILDQQNRSWKNVLLWIACTFSSFLWYKYVVSFSPRTYHYVNLMSWESIMEMIKHYLSACGSIFEFVSHNRAIATGLIMNLLFLYLLLKRRKYISPELYGMVIFLMLSFLAIAYGRAEEGFTQAFSSRYKLYSMFYFILNISLYLSAWKRGRIPLLILALVLVMQVMPRYHKRNLPLVKKRSKELTYGITHFSFNPTDTIWLPYNPNQTLPRNTLRTSARLGIFSNDHILRLLSESE